MKQKYINIGIENDFNLQILSFAFRDSLIWSYFVNKDRLNEKDTLSFYLPVRPLSGASEGAI
jgi:hypothetical protein